MKRRLLSLSLLLAFMSLAGCGDQAGVSAPPPADVPDQAFLDQGESLVAFINTAKEASNWQEAEQAMLDVLELPSPVPRAMREAQAAQVLLDKWLLEGDSSPEKQVAIAKYTDILLDQPNPKPALMLRAIKQLDGYWPQERRAEATRLALQASASKSAHAPTLLTAAPPSLQEQIQSRQQAEQAAVLELEQMLAAHQE